MILALKALGALAAAMALAACSHGPIAPSGSDGSPLQIQQQGSFAAGG